MRVGQERTKEESHDVGDRRQGDYSIIERSGSGSGWTRSRRGSERYSKLQPLDEIGQFQLDWLVYPARC